MAGRADGGRRRLTADGEQRSSAMEGGGGQQVGSVVEYCSRLKCIVPLSSAYNNLESGNYIDVHLIPLPRR